MKVYGTYIYKSSLMFLIIISENLVEFDMVFKVQNSQTDKIECLFHLQERVHFTHD